MRTVICFGAACNAVVCIYHRFTATPTCDLTQTTALRSLSLPTDAAYLLTVINTVSTMCICSMPSRTIYSSQPLAIRITRGKQPLRISHFLALLMTNQPPCQKHTCSMLHSAPPRFRNARPGKTADTLGSVLPPYKCRVKSFSLPFRDALEHIASFKKSGFKLRKTSSVDPRQNAGTA